MAEIQTSLATSGEGLGRSEGTARAATKAAAEVAAAMLDSRPLPVSLTSFPVGPSTSSDGRRCGSVGIRRDAAGDDGLPLKSS